MAALRFCGVTPARGEDLAGVAVLLQRERQQQPLDGDEAVAGLLGDLLGVVEHAAPSPAPDRPGRRRRPTPSASCRARPRPLVSAWRELPPERSIRPAARPSGSSSSTLSSARARTAGGPRAAPAIARIERNRGRGRCISRYSCVRSPRAQCAAPGSTDLDTEHPPPRCRKDNLSWSEGGFP